MFADWFSRDLFKVVHDRNTIQKTQSAIVPLKYPRTWSFLIQDCAELVF